MGLLDELDEIDRQKSLAAKTNEIGLAAELDEIDALDTQYHQNKALRTAFPVLSSEYGDSLAAQQQMQSELGSLQKAQQFYPNFEQRKKQAEIDMMQGSGMKNATVAALNVVPEFLRIVGQGSQLLTGGEFGQGLENLATGVSQDIYRDYATPKLLEQQKLLATAPDKLDAILSNPGAAATVATPSLVASMAPSTALGSIAGKTALRYGLGAQRAGDIAGDVANLSNVFMNASQGFAEKNQEGMNPLQNLIGATAGALVNRGIGSKLGGGAEGALARAMSGTGTGLVGKALLAAPIKGALDELGDNLSIETSKAVSENRTPDIAGTVEDSIIDMIAGGILGGAGDVSSSLQTAKQAKEIKADPVAKAIWDLEQEEKAKQQQAPKVEVKPEVAPQQPEPQTAANPVLNALNAIQEKIEAEKPQERVEAQPVAQPQQEEGQVVASEPQAEVRRIDRKILQNRERNDKDSVSQMRTIANKPDYGRVGYSRDFANGAPVVAFGSIPEEQKGRTDFAVAHTGERIPVQYAVVDADTVSTSNDINGAENPDYGLTDRVMAVAGNGRVTALDQAYRQGSAGTYRQELTEDTMHGVNPEVVAKMKNPILVRIMPNERVRDDIGDLSNVSSNKSLSAIEQANNDARRVDLKSLKFNEDGSVSKESLAQFVAAMPPTERGALIDKDGRPSSQAVDRLNNAIFTKAYNNDDIAAMYVQATNPEAKLVINALARLAPKMAKLEGCGELDFRDALVDAVNAIVQGKSEDLSMQDILAQQDFFADPDVALFVELFARNPRSNKDAIAILSDAADFAYSEATKSDEDMFGEVQKAERGDVMNYVRDELNKVKEVKNGKQAKQQAAVQDASGGIGAPQNVDGRDAGANQGTNERAGSADSQADEGFSLSRQTEQEINAEAEAEEERQAQAEREAKADAERQEAENLRKEVEQSNEDYADNFALEDDTVTGEDALRDQKVLFSRKSEIKDPLVTLHNITENGLMKAARLGGLPAPSLAVSKASSPLQQFGEITLVGTKVLADPKKNPVFSVDAYTKRFPRLDWSKSLKKDEARSLRHEIELAQERVGEGASNNRVTYYLYNRPNKDMAIEKLTDSAAGMAMFLDHKGVSFKSVKKQAKRAWGVNDYTISAYKEIAKKFGDVDVGSQNEARKLFAKAMRDWAKSELDNGGSSFAYVNQVLNGIVASYESDPYLTDGTVRKVELVDIAEAVREYIAEEARLKSQLVVDDVETKKLLEKKVSRYQSEYQQYIQEKVSNAFGNPGVVDGNKVVPLTLENVVRAMTRGEIRAAEEGFASNVSGAIRAKASKQYEDMEDLQADRDRVVSRDESWESEKEVDAKFDAFISSVSKYWKYPTSSFGMEDLEGARNVLIKCAQNPTKANLKRALKNEGFDGVDDATIEIGIDALKSARQVLTDYLEIKPQRAVAFSEFAGAVVPNTISEEARAVLEDAGLEIQTYNPKLEGGRVRATQRLINRLDRGRGDIKFSRNPRTGKMDIKLSIAWHGSPHVFEVFLTDHIGTGEGAQAHGWGLYFAASQAVAENYRRRLTNDNNQTIEILGQLVDPDSMEGDATGLGIAVDAIRWAITLPDGSFDTSPITETSISSIQYEAESMLEEYREDNPDLSDEVDEALEIISGLKPEDIKYRSIGRVFKVEVPDESLMLDEQKQFKDQPKHVQDALNRVVDNLIAEGIVDESFRDFIKNESGWGIYWSIGQKYDAKYGDDFDSLKAASLALNAEGIPGITYYGHLDGRCYVVFDDAAVKVLEFYSKNKPEESTSGSTVEEVTDTLGSDKEVGGAFNALQESGEVTVVQSVEDLPEEIRSQIDDANKSKRNTLTGNVVNDSAVTPENDIGYVGTVNFKNVKHDFPSGDVVVRPGHHREPHSGMGAKHLTANVLKETARDRYPDLENKTESGLRGVRDVLRTATTMYRVDEPRRDVQYVFYSPKLRQAVVTAYKYEKGVFEVITNTPVSNPQDRWGADFVSLSGALAIPENEASASSPSSSSTSDGNAEGLRLPKALKGKYIDVDYTEEMRGALQIKRSDNGDIQGLYDPRTGKAYLIADALTDKTAKPVFLHELGVHASYGKNPLKLEAQMKLARNMVNNGYAQGNDMAIRVKQRLFDANEIDSMDAPIPMDAAEECMSYLVEETASTDDRGPFRKWFDSVITAIKQWLRSHGINVNLNEWDFVEIAKGNVVAMAKQSGKDMNLSYSKKGKKNPVPSNGSAPQPNGGRFLERDELGRFRLKAGRKLIEGLGYTVAAVDSLLPVAYKISNAPQALRIQIRDMKAKIEKAGMDATEMAKLMKEMPEAERKLISDVVEQELETGINPPDHVMQIATKITQIMDEQSKELVELGMLSQESYERYRGKYLPRFYLRADEKEQIGFFAKIFGGRARMRGVAGTHLKGRGIFKEVPAKAAHNFIKLGWEVRDPNYEYVNGKVQPRQGRVEGVDDTGMVMIWRDYRKDEREEMGEIRDASYRFAVGYMETQRDLAIGRLFKAIASNPDWTSSTAREGFVYVPKSEVPDAGGVLKYGALAGKYVDEVVLSHISHIEDIPDGLMRAFRQGMAFWKEGKTAMNPVSHMNNTVGNFVAAHLAGVDMWDAKAYSKALHSMRTADESFKEAQDAGLFSGSFSQEEFVQSLPEELKHLAQQEETGFKKFSDTLMRVFTWGLRDKLRMAYEFEDAFFKMAIYQKAREAGMDPKHAVDYAHKFVFVYDTLPEGARKLRNSLFPFFAWTYQAVPMLATAAVCYPWRFFAPAAILYALNKAFFLAAAGDDDDTWAERWKKASQLEDAERTLLPKYMQGNTLFMTPKFLRLGIDEATGLPQYLNLSHMVPGGNFLDFENQMGGVPLPEILTPNHPLLNAFMAYIGNRDMFSGFDVTKKPDTTGEKVQKYAEYTWKQLTPAIAIGNYHWNRLMDGVAGATGVTMPIDRTGVNRHGEVTTLYVAIQNMMGLKVRTFDPDNELNRQLRGHKSDMSMIQSEKRSAYRRARAGALPIDSYQDYAKTADEKVRKVRGEMGELRKARATVKDLSGK